MRKQQHPTLLVFSTLVIPLAWFAQSPSPISGEQASTAPAVEVTDAVLAAPPSVSLARFPDRSVLEIHSNDDRLGLAGLDWSSLQFEVNGEEATAAILPRLGDFAWSYILNDSDRPVGVSIDIDDGTGVDPLAGLAVMGGIQKLPGVGGGWGSSQTMLRNASCAPSVACTDGRMEVTSHWYNEAGFQSSPFYFSTSSVRVLTGFRGIGQVIGHVDWNQVTWHLDIFEAASGLSLEDVWFSNPTHGNVYDDHFRGFHFPMSATRELLSNGDYMITLSPPQNVVLPPGDYLVSVSAFATSWYWRESSRNLGSDIFTAPSLGRWYTYNPELGYPTGTQAVDVFGY